VLQRKQGGKVNIGPGVVYPGSKMTLFEIFNVEAEDTEFARGSGTFDISFAEMTAANVVPS